MRIAYLFNRGEKTASDWGCSRVFIDTPETKREALTDITGGNLRIERGDVLVVHSESDLGKGPGLKRLRDFFADKGVNIEVRGKPETAYAKHSARGIPLAARHKAQPRWHLPGCDIDGLNRYLADEGKKVGEDWGPWKRHQFIFALGNMGDPPRDLPPLESNG